jgi:hypothetical protein
MNREEITKIANKLEAESDKRILQLFKDKGVLNVKYPDLEKLSALTSEEIEKYPEEIQKQLTAEIWDRTHNPFKKQ